MSGCYPGCFYYTDSCFRKDCTMTTPAHKHVGDAGKPGQIVNPINTDLMDDMGKYAAPTLTRRGNPLPEASKTVTWGGINTGTLSVNRAVPKTAATVAEILRAMKDEHIKAIRHHADCLRQLGIDPATHI